MAANQIKRPWQSAKKAISIKSNTTTANIKDQEKAVSEVRPEGKNALPPEDHRVNGTINCDIVK